MKFLFKLIVLPILAVTLYIVSYFVIMEKGTAINKKTLLPEYSSISRFGSSEKKIGPISIRVTHTSWLNPIYEPLDRIFR